MRLGWLTVLVALIPALAAGQSHRTPAEPGSLPAIGLPLPPIGLPLPSIGLPPATAEPSHARARPSPPKRNDRRHGGAKRGRARSPAIFFGPAYGWVDPWMREPEPPSVGYESSPYDEPIPPTGTLRLDVQPHGIVQLYVDGYYVGTVDDVNGELALEPGAHRIEMRAPGYETAIVDVKIERDRAITYRGALERRGAMTPAPEPPIRPDVSQPPRSPEPVYIIPGCYLGNIPPKDAGLPATCDPSRVIVLGQ